MAGSTEINVGTRNSQLALIQTNRVIEKLEQFYSNNPDQVERLQQLGHRIKSKLQFNVVPMTTTGDKILDKPLIEIGSKSLFTKELEIELLTGRIDFIVHSLKDLPTKLPEGCSIGAILERDNPNDAIVLKKSLRSHIKPIELLLNSNCDDKTYKIGTSSQRRIAMIRRCNRMLECIDIRGNLNTRLRKLDEDSGEYAALILAKAGLDRMNWSDRASSLLTPEIDAKLDHWAYAVGQGAIAVECRSDDWLTIELLRPISHLKTTYEAISERSLMRKLEGGCSVPLGVRSRWLGNGTLELKAIVLSLDGTSEVSARSCVSLSEPNDEKTSKIENDTINLEARMTGVILARSYSQNAYIAGNLVNCCKLGQKVANKMIDSGCLDLMKCL